MFYKKMFYKKNSNIERCVDSPITMLFNFHEGNIFSKKVPSLLHDSNP